MKRVVFIIVIIMYSCRSTKITLLESDKSYQVCNLFPVEMNIDTNSINSFRSQVSSFLTEKNEFDIIKIYSTDDKMKDKLTRWCVNGNEIVVHKCLKGKCNVLKKYYNSIELKRYLSVIENKSFIQFCPYNCSYNSSIIHIKLRGKYLFKYTSNSSDYFALSSKERDKMKDVINLINYLDNEW